jgi:hypothetical protein
VRDRPEIVDPSDWGLPVIDGAPGAATLFWGIPKVHVIFVQRKGTTVERFPPWIRTALGFVLCLGSARFSLTPNRLRL